jgi:lipopolysaccharide/colanic/teichoic acid biosynthesis glycosyltransferase
MRLSPSAETSVYAPPRAVGAGYHITKRVVDICLALILLVLLSPILIVAMVAIILESRGGVFFVQERMGVKVNRLSGAVALRPFRMIKLRSMHPGEDEEHRLHIEQLADSSGEPIDGASIKASSLRTTRVGRVIRLLSIDEVPQLVNVLLGQMSLVGPRPVPMYEAELLERCAPERFLAVPGLTGLWQVEGRCALPFDEMQRLDREYIGQRSLLYDMKILLRTVPAVLSTKGAG